MTTERARAIAAHYGWTIERKHGVYHVLDGGLPIGAARTIALAVESVIDRMNP